MDHVQDEIAPFFPSPPFYNLKNPGDNKPNKQRKTLKSGKKKAVGLTTSGLEKGHGDETPEFLSCLSYVPDRFLPPTWNCQ